MARSDGRMGSGRGGEEGLKLAVFGSEEVADRYPDWDSRVAFSWLGERDQRILSLRFGLGRQGERVSYAAVGRELGISGGRVSQIVERIMRRIRHPARRRAKPASAEELGRGQPP